MAATPSTSSKRRKVDSECRGFNPVWRENYLFAERYGKADVLTFFFQPGPRQACLGLIWPATQKSLPTPAVAFSRIFSRICLELFACWHKYIYITLSEYLDIHRNISNIYGTTYGLIYIYIYIPTYIPIYIYIYLHIYLYIYITLYSENFSH